MIILKSLLTEAKLSKISLQEAKDKNLFGPVFHGTNEQNRSKIDGEGFKVVSGMLGTSGMSHGYENTPYGSSSFPPPIHHLGFGIYFTTVKSIAKQFSGGTLRGMKIYFLDAPRREEINFASPNNMMKWWIKNGYNPELASKGEVGRYAATVKLTDELKSKYDAVWFKGRGMYRLLDGDQVVVFDPSHIYEIDLSMAKGLEVGAKVRAKHRIARIYSDGLEHGAVEVGTKGIVLKRENIEQKRIEYPTHWAKRAEKYVLNIKFKPGGDWQVEDVDVEPLS